VIKSHEELQQSYKSTTGWLSEGFWEYKESYATEGYTSSDGQTFVAV
jgi:uncharacterized membrane protein